MRIVAVLVAAALALAACGTAAGSASTVSPAGPSDGETLDPGRSDTGADDPGPVPAADLDAAEQVVLGFLDALGAGDVDTAAALVGPVSEQRAGEAGGLQSLLQQATEGHGAWAAATERRVTPVGMAPGLVAVVLEGRLQVEGSSEHRVDVFPARRAESAGAWFVEPGPAT